MKGLIHADSSIASTYARRELGLQLTNVLLALGSAFVKLFSGFRFCKSRSALLKCRHSSPILRQPRQIAPNHVLWYTAPSGPVETLECRATG